MQYGLSLASLLSVIRDDDERKSLTLNWFRIIFFNLLRDDL